MKRRERRGKTNAKDASDSPGATNSEEGSEEQDLGTDDSFRQGKVSRVEHTEVCHRVHSTRVIEPCLIESRLFQLHLLSK